MTYIDSSRQLPPKPRWRMQDLAAVVGCSILAVRQAYRSGTGTKFERIADAACKLGMVPPCQQRPPRRSPEERGIETHEIVYPLRRDFTIRLTLPRNMTTREWARIVGALATFNGEVFDVMKGEIFDRLMKLR